VCEYIVATWLNNNPTILKQSQIEKKITFMNQYNAGKFDKKHNSPDRQKGSKVTTLHVSAEKDKEEDEAFTLIDKIMEKPHIPEDNEKSPFEVMMAI